MTLPNHAGISTNVNAPPVAATEWNAVINTLNALTVTSSIVTVCTSSTRPTSGLATGRLIFETDTGQLAEYNGSGWTYPTVPGVSTAWQRKASGISTVIATTVTAEVLVTSATFTAVSGRRYRVDVSGSFNGPTGSALAFRCRWAVGASVTTSGADFYEVQALPVSGLSETSSGFTEVAPGTFTAGQVTVGAFAIQLATGGGTTKYGNGTLQPTVISITDVGT